MKIKKEELYPEPERELYWAKIWMESDDAKKSSLVLVSVSDRYIDFNPRKFEEGKEEWFQNVVEKWKSMGDKVFDQDVHYDVYAMESGGKARGLEFLQREIKL